jgi:hypothetical protein
LLNWKNQNRQAIRAVLILLVILLFFN